MIFNISYKNQKKIQIPSSPVSLTIEFLDSRVATKPLNEGAASARTITQRILL